MCFECVTTIVDDEMLSLSPTVGYRWHRSTKFTFAATSDAKMALGVGALGHWGGSNKDVHYVWPDTGQFMLKNSRDLKELPEFIDFTPLRGRCDLFTITRLNQ